MAAVCDWRRSRAMPGKAFSRVPVRKARPPDAGSQVAICIQRPTGDDVEQLLRKIPIKTLNPSRLETLRSMRFGRGGMVGVAREPQRLAFGKAVMPSRAWRSGIQ